ncbi:hypothetical protein LIER_29310 [Lithospermum erythrorhizon]|uniref:Uncharacterized protein n=1 Tax=Lithospermum erythrorhizon TaxID=34254 RepID=A0AAV3RMU4_LITER
MMERKFVVLALMFLAVGGLTSANSAPTPDPSLFPNEEASSTSPVDEATTNDTPNVPPTLNEDDLLSDPPIIEDPSVASPDNELLAPSTEGPSADSPNNELSSPPTEGPSIASADNEISVPPTQGPSPVEGYVAEAPIGLVDEEGFPIDTAPTPEIEMPPPTVSTPSPPLNATSTGVPYSGASTLKISSVIVLTGAVGVFSL